MTTRADVRKDKYDVYCGRGSMFGNSYTHLPVYNTIAEVQVATREDAIMQYKLYFDKRIREDMVFKESVKRLKDKRLGCYCDDTKACHVQVIIDYLERV